MHDAKADYLRRVTPMHHRTIAKKRSLEMRKNRLEKIHKMEEENATHDKNIKANMDVVHKLLNAAEEKGYLEQRYCLSDESNLKVCLLEGFRVLRVLDLKAFIVAHEDELLRMKDISIKDTVKETMEHIVQNATMVAYIYREKPKLSGGEASS